jgi:hypothetical protein
VAVDVGAGAGTGGCGPVEAVEVRIGADGTFAGIGAVVSILALSVVLVISMDVVVGAFSTGAVLALSFALLIVSIGVTAGALRTGAVMALSSALLVVSIGVVVVVIIVVAGGFSTGAVSILALSSVLLVVSIGVVAGVKCAIDGWEENIALGTANAFAKENGAAAEVVASAKGCACSCACCVGSVAANGGFV